MKRFNCLSLFFFKTVDKPNVFFESIIYLKHCGFYLDNGDEMNLRESLLIKTFITGFQHH